ncbi:MAG: hypothetical protein U0Y68_17440 [Blastocatellia bacterium]
MISAWRRWIAIEHIRRRKVHTAFVIRRNRLQSSCDGPADGVGEQGGIHQFAARLEFGNEHRRGSDGMRRGIRAWRRGKWDVSVAVPA